MIAAENVASLEVALEELRGVDDSLSRKHQC
ncbi:MAG: hypothetical protein ACJAQT_003991 [Akkermansiaceae bacterium]|jgi:hypothetical protein